MNKRQNKIKKLKRINEAIWGELPYLNIQGLELRKRWHNEKYKQRVYRAFFPNRGLISDTADLMAA